jgi:hypothetical protein
MFQTIIKLFISSVIIVIVSEIAKKKYFPGRFDCIDLSYFDTVYDLAIYGYEKY